MSKRKKLLVGLPALLAIAVVGYAINSHNGKITAATAASEKAEPRLTWAAAAPGRVEPKSGEIHLRSDLIGKVTVLAVNEGDRVIAGQLLFKQDDETALANLRKAEAEIEALEKRRNDAKLTRRSKKRRDAENNLSQADRDLLEARQNLDRFSLAKHDGTASEEDVQRAVEDVKTAQRVVETRWIALRSVRKEQENPTSLPEEAALATARAQLTLAIAALEKTRIRAPQAGEILKIDAKIGEIIAPNSPRAAIIIGDVSSLRVRAEVDERDVAKIRLKQEVIVRADGFPNNDFSGNVQSIAATLGPAQLNKRGASRPNDATVLEVKIEVSGKTPLLPGMEVDVLFSPKKTDPSKEKTALKEK
ncbi:MAG: HlyD family secretion protein [Methyloligellaceae bacterium]